MGNSRVIQGLGIFFFGLAVGAFFTLTVIREAVPLRDHVWMIAWSVAMGGPIILGLLIWYLRLANSCRQVLGQKGGNLINSLLSFQIASTILIFIVLLSIFYAAIA